MYEKGYIGLEFNMIFVYLFYGKKIIEEKMCMKKIFMGLVIF